VPRQTQTLPAKIRLSSANRSLEVINALERPHDLDFNLGFD
jgi:hypothetical protein